ncbi:iron-containing redox enzyme family protein [Burkholderia glumae]|uniref:iron-containing redox enzyme family protein n=1 Tax=Burkholderia glumae TaxID=337 RepID=UPI00214A2913|nr:iron-containing redox enzyme family protein [Burkholderia glumae]
MSELQRALYIANRAQTKRLTPVEDRLLAFERDWTSSTISRVSPCDLPVDLDELKQRLAALIKQDEEDDAESVRYVAEQMSLEEFRILVQEFAADGLTEAQVFYYLMPRLSLEAQMPVLRMLVDEFGSGNLQRSHTALYIKLLEELGLPSDLNYYIDNVSPAAFAFVNMFYWLTVRADDPSYFAGVITYFESIIPSFFLCYTRACERLGVSAHHYYSEHVHIDVFHAIEGHRLLRAMDKAGQLDCAKAWQGVCFGREITTQAFEAAVSKARHYAREYS